MYKLLNNSYLVLNSNENITGYLAETLSILIFYLSVKWVYLFIPTRVYLFIPVQWLTLDSTRPNTSLLHNIPDTLQPKYAT